MTAQSASLGLVIGGGAEDLARLARHAERAGLDHVWLHEAGTDAAVAATVVVLATDRIGVGTDVQVVRATHDTLAGTPTNFVGNHYRVTRPAPYGVVHRDRVRPATMVAAVGPRMIATATRHADGLLGHPFTSPAFITNHLVPAVSAGLQHRGRDRADFLLATGVIASVDPDRDQARRRACRQVALYGTTRAYRAVFAANGHDELSDSCRTILHEHGIDRLHEAVPDDLLDHYALAGTPDEVLDGLPGWRGLVDHLILSPPTVGLTASERAAATERVASMAAVHAERT